jgi:anti-sigma factor RsiW
MGVAKPDGSHEQWHAQINAELDGELSLIERTALAKHLATCSHCAGARASQLEVRVALARSAGNPHAVVVPRPSIRAGTLLLWIMVSLAAGLVGGWLANRTWGGPGSGAALEDARGTIVVQ